MSTEFNYVARLDTSQIMSGLSEIRSQVGMTLGGAGAFGGGTLSQTNFGGGAAQGMGQMLGSFSQGFGTPTLGGTFTDPAIAYTPNYGRGPLMTREQEKLVLEGGQGRTGMEWAGKFTPPGMAAGEFAFAAFGNNLDRSIQSREAASLAGVSALTSSAGGLLAGDLAQTFIGAPLGSWLGGKAASSLLGAGAKGAGQLLGGIAGGLGAFMLAGDYVGGKIQDHYAEIEQTLGATRELGDIVGGGRGLNRKQQYEMGIAARDAAKSMGMDVNQMGDILSLAREGGMLPSLGDPGKTKQQIIDLATAINEASQTLHSSLATARDVIKSSAQQGISVEEGMIRAEMGTLGGGRGSILHGMGVSAARSMNFTGAHGGQLFAGAAGQAAGAGLSREELQILGGQTGVAALIGGTQLAAAASPMGTLQLMAAQSGRPLGGVMDLPGQALEAMSSGGDMIGSMIKFQVHGDEYRRGLGAKGIRTMALSQIDSVAELYSGLSSSVSQREARQMAAMNLYGMNGTQAEAYIGGLSRAPGGAKDDGFERAHAIATIDRKRQINLATKGLKTLPTGTDDGWTDSLWRGITDVTEGVGDLFQGANVGSDRRGMLAGARYDKGEGMVLDRLGIVPINLAEETTRGMTADLRGLTMQMARPLGSIATTTVQNMSEASLRIAGLTPVAPGPGTVAFSGGIAFSAVDIQKLGNRVGTAGKQLKAKDARRAQNLAYEMFHDPGAADRFAAGEFPEAFGVLTVPWEDMNQAERWQVAIGGQVEAINTSVQILTTNSPNEEEYQTVATGFNEQVRALGRSIKDPKEREAFIKEMDSGSYLAENSMAGQALIAGGVNLTPLRDRVGANARQALGIAVYETAAASNDARARIIGKRIAPGATPEEQSSIGNEVSRDDEFKGITRRLAGGERGQKIDDEFKRMAERAEVRLGADGVKGSSKLALDGFSLATEYMQRDNSSGVVKDIAVTLGDSLGLDHTKLRKTGFAERREGQTHSRAIGFGEQEQAMSAINRSLKRTHDMIATLEVKVNGKSGQPKGADNQAPAAPAGPP